MKKHILVISQYFYPEQFRINDMCEEWVERGYKVTVVTGIPNYPHGKFFKGYNFFKRRKENYKGMEIIRLPIIPRGNNSLFLAMNYLSFVISGYLWKLFTRVKADHVFIFEVSPMTQALPGVWYAKKRNIPCYLYVQDLWPENVEIVTGITNRKIIGPIEKMVNYIYRNCDRIFATSKSFVRSIQQRGVPDHKIEFWPQYAEDFYEKLESTSISEIPDDNAFNVIFAGNIGNAQGLDILPKTAEILKQKKRNIRFNVVGDGRYKNELISEVEKRNVREMFNFIPRQPATRIPEFMAASDAAFLCLTNNRLFEMTIPAKLQSYMACGAPIIASADGEVKRIINESESGFCSEAGNAESLAENLLRIAELNDADLNQLGHNAKRYYDSNFNKEKLLDHMDQKFNEELKLGGEKIV
ncbi:glycosyltransferase family 4 protein [Alteribacter lacisalsi]|uniref:glycosyltransferase family 4 protein n=1 Tax=Alteribacter lacisalsi TaxID=2045244 RepID=UPI00191C3035|nr:glycosyltransferase family 4 protein [Alteribacter lacisalsi]